MADHARTAFAGPMSGVIVTGGASGLGLASAEALAAAGRPVALWDIDAAATDAAASRLRKSYPVVVFGIVVDVADVDGVAGAILQTRSALPSIGGLVHCAGISERCGFDAFDPDQFDRAMQIHVRAIPLIVRGVLADLRDNPGSSVLALSSIQARMGEGHAPSYTAAKGAVISLVLSLADALAKDGIRANSLSPGMMRTPMFDRALPEGPRRTATVARTMLQRLGEPGEIGSVVRFLMSDEASYITGADLIVDGGYVASARRHPPPPDQGVVL